MNDYEIKELSVRRDTVVDSIFDDILALLEMAASDGIEWLSTQEIIAYIGNGHGNHINGILRTMAHCSVIIGAQAVCHSSGKHVHVWKVNDIPF